MRDNSKFRKSEMFHINTSNTDATNQKFSALILLNLFFSLHQLVAILFLCILIYFLNLDQLNSGLILYLIFFTWIFFSNQSRPSISTLLYLLKLFLSSFLFAFLCAQSTISSSPCLLDPILFWPDSFYRRLTSVSFRILPTFLLWKNKTELRKKSVYFLYSDRSILFCPFRLKNRFDFNFLL